MDGVTTAHRSAQPCGCDAGENYLCEVHTLAKYIDDQALASFDAEHGVHASSPLAVGAGQTGEQVKVMEYSARQNEIARKASGGELLSRRTIIGAMDHALEVHASALRLLEAKIVAQKNYQDRANEIYEERIAALTERINQIDDRCSCADCSE